MSHTQTCSQLDPRSTVDNTSSTICLSGATLRRWYGPVELHHGVTPQPVGQIYYKFAQCIALLDHYKTYCTISSAILSWWRKNRDGVMFSSFSC